MSVRRLFADFVILLVGRIEDLQIIEHLFVYHCRVSTIQFNESGLRQLGRDAAKCVAKQVQPKTDAVVAAHSGDEVDVVMPALRKALAGLRLAGGEEQLRALAETVASHGWCKRLAP
jgi:hypothetical protein